MSVNYEQLAGDGLEQIGATTSRGQLDQITIQSGILPDSRRTP